MLASAADSKPPRAALDGNVLWPRGPYVQVHPVSEEAHVHNEPVASEIEEHPVRGIPCVQGICGQPSEARRHQGHTDQQSGKVASFHDAVSQ